MVRTRSSWGFFVGSILTYLALLWLISSLFRSAGFGVFLGGLAALAACLVAFRRGRHRALFCLYLAAILASAAIASFESILHLAPHLFTGMAGNYAYSRYHHYVGGIYDLDAHEGKVLRPGVVRETYLNGYHWRHDANAQGFRGPALAHADAVFVGDSMIYGQGVETEQAVPARFGARTGQRVANLGIAGTGLIQSWLRLRRVGMPLKPRLIFVCAHPNDLGDVSQFYSPAEVQRFVASPVDSEDAPTARPRFQPHAWWHPKQLWESRLALPLCAAGAIRLLGQSARHGLDWRKPVATTPVARAYTPEASWKAPQTPAEHLAWQAHCHALAKIVSLGRKAGATVAVFDLGFPEGFSRAMEAEAHRLGVAYVAAGRTAFSRGLAGEDVYLPEDGHWSPRGCDVIAEELVRWYRLTNAPAPTGQ